MFKKLQLTIIACSLVAVLGGFMSFSTAEDKPAAKKEKHLRHIVMYKFKPEMTEKQIQEVVDAFSGLPSKINTITGYEHGTNVSQENKPEGFTHVFIVTFRDAAGRDAYLKHPAHDDYVKVVKDRREKVIVFDYWTE